MKTQLEKLWQAFDAYADTLEAEEYEIFEEEFQTLSEQAENVIPISWIQTYAKENGPEASEIISYMLKEYKERA